MLNGKLEAEAQQQAKAPVLRDWFLGLLALVALAASALAWAWQASASPAFAPRFPAKWALAALPLAGLGGLAWAYAPRGDAPLERFAPSVSGRLARSTPPRSNLVTKEGLLEEGDVPPHVDSSKLTPERSGEVEGPHQGQIVPKSEAPQGFQNAAQLEELTDRFAEKVQGIVGQLKQGEEGNKAQKLDPQEEAIAQRKAQYEATIEKVTVKEALIVLWRGERPPAEWGRLRLELAPEAFVEYVSRADPTLLDSVAFNYAQGRRYALDLTDEAIGGRLTSLFNGYVQHVLPNRSLELQLKRREISAAWRVETDRLLGSDEIWPILTFHYWETARKLVTKRKKFLVFLKSLEAYLTGGLIVPDKAMGQRALANWLLKNDFEKELKARLTSQYVKYVLGKANVEEGQGLIYERAYIRAKFEEGALKHHLATASWKALELEEADVEQIYTPLLEGLWYRGEHGLVDAFPATWREEVRERFEARFWSHESSSELRFALDSMSLDFKTEATLLFRAAALQWQQESSSLEDQIKQLVRDRDALNDRSVALGEIWRKAAIDAKDRHRAFEEAREVLVYAAPRDSVPVEVVDGQLLPVRHLDADYEWAEDTFARPCVPHPAELEGLEDLAGLEDLLERVEAAESGQPEEERFKTKRLRVLRDYWAKKGSEHHLDREEEVCVHLGGEGQDARYELRTAVVEGHKAAWEKELNQWVAETKEDPVFASINEQEKIIQDVRAQQLALEEKGRSLGLLELEPPETPSLLLVEQWRSYVGQAPFSLRRFVEAPFSSSFGRKGLEGQVDQDVRKSFDEELESPWDPQIPSHPADLGKAGSTSKHNPKAVPAHHRHPWYVALLKKSRWKWSEIDSLVFRLHAQTTYTPARQHFIDGGYFQSWLSACRALIGRLDPHEAMRYEENLGRFRLDFLNLPGAANIKPLDAAFERDFQLSVKDSTKYIGEANKQDQPQGKRKLTLRQMIEEQHHTSAYQLEYEALMAEVPEPLRPDLQVALLEFFRLERFNRRIEAKEKLSPEEMKALQASRQACEANRKRLTPAVYERCLQLVEDYQEEFEKIDAMYEKLRSQAEAEYKLKEEVLQQERVKTQQRITELVEENRTVTAAKKEFQERYETLASQDHTLSLQGLPPNHPRRLLLQQAMAEEKKLILMDEKETIKWKLSIKQGMDDYIQDGLATGKFSIDNLHKNYYFTQSMQLIIHEMAIQVLAQLKETRLADIEALGKIADDLVPLMEAQGLKQAYLSLQEWKNYSDDDWKNQQKQLLDKTDTRLLQAIDQKVLVDLHRPDYIQKRFAPHLVNPWLTFDLHYHHLPGLEKYFSMSLIEWKGQLGQLLRQIIDPSEQRAFMEIMWQMIQDSKQLWPSLKDLEQQLQALGTNDPREVFIKERVFLQDGVHPTLEKDLLLLEDYRNLSPTERWHLWHSASLGSPKLNVTLDQLVWKASKVKAEKRHELEKMIKKVQEVQTWRRLMASMDLPTVISYLRARNLKLMTPTVLLESSKGNPLRLPQAIEQRVVTNMRSLTLEELRNLQQEDTLAFVDQVIGNMPADSEIVKNWKEELNTLTVEERAARDQGLTELARQKVEARAVLLSKIVLIAQQERDKDQDRLIQQINSKDKDDE